MTSPKRTGDVQALPLGSQVVTALQGRPLTTVPPRKNQSLVWNGTAWTPGTPITTSALSGGPPSAPSDGDIWIATAVDANGTRWQFQYNAGSGSSFKWEFIGGSPLVVSSSPSGIISTGTQVGSSGWFYDPTGMSYTTARAGDYIVDGGADISSNGGGSTFVEAATFVGAAISAIKDDYGLNTTINGSQSAVVRPLKLSGVAASTVIGVAVVSGLNATYKIATGSARITPVRVS